MNKVVLGLVGAAILAGLYLVLRPEDDGQNASPPPPPATTGTNTTSTQTTTRPRSPTTISIVVKGGHVVGGIRRARLHRGETAVIVVRADISDEVHLHGYDVMRDVSPAQPARLRFKASIPGRFEVELEERKLQIAQLEVRP
jgi:hypothetical protein